VILDAVRNNAEWCELMCRAHGHNSLFGKEAWTSARRTPPLYPDAVTLLPDANQAAILGLIDTRPGCSIKDSFARLDLSSAGFEPIVQAHWIYRPADCPAPPPPVPWSAVDTADELAAWATAWDGGPTDLIRPELLDFPAVRVLAAHHDGAIAAGAVVNHSGPVIGVSLLFTRAGDLEAAWAGVLSALPGQHVVGYETGPALAAALRLRFALIGPLRVWLRKTPT
jgi:hypothetical protein